MTVTLSRAYGPYASGAIVTLPDNTESALIAQGIATAGPKTVMSSIIGGPDQQVAQGGSLAIAQQVGQSLPVTPQGPLNLPCIALGSLALTSYETSGTAPAAIGSIYYTEIFVPYWNQWTGIGLLNGTTVGTDNHLVALYGSDGSLIATSALAGAVSASASVFQPYAFINPIVLAPGRYFLAYQSNGATDTLRHLVSANGTNVVTGVQTGVFGTVPAITTVSKTFTTVQGVISQLYT